MTTSYRAALDAAQLPWDPDVLDPHNRVAPREWPMRTMMQNREADAARERVRAQAVAVALDPSASVEDLRSAILRATEAHLPARALAMAAQPTLTPALAVALTDLDEPRVLEALANNPKTPSALVERIARQCWDATTSPARQTWLAALANPRLPATTAQEALNTYAAIDDVFTSVLRHPGLLPEQLVAQIRSDTPAARLALVANHPALPEKAIERLGREKRTSVLIALLGTDAVLPLRFLERLATHPSPAVIAAVLQQPGEGLLPETVQDLLVNPATTLPTHFPAKLPAMGSSAQTRWRNDRSDLAQAMLTSTRIAPERLAAVLSTALDHPKDFFPTPLWNGTRAAAAHRPVPLEIQRLLPKMVRARMDEALQLAQAQPTKSLSVQWMHDTAPLVGDLLLTRPEADPVVLMEIAGLLSQWCARVATDPQIPVYQARYQLEPFVACVVRLGRTPQRETPAVREWVTQLLSYPEARPLVKDMTTQPEQRELLRGSYQARRVAEKLEQEGAASRIIQWPAPGEASVPFAFNWGLTPTDLRPLLLDKAPEMRVWATQLLGQLRERTESAPSQDLAPELSRGASRPATI